MKPITLLLLIGCLFSIIYTAEYCGDLGKDAQGNSIRPSSKEDCTNYKQTKYQKVDGDSCCYVVRVTGYGEYKECESYNKKYVTKDYIENYIKEYNSDEYVKANEKYKITSLSIECGCNWLSFSLIFTFLVFIF